MKKYIISFLSMVILAFSVTGIYTSAEQATQASAKASTAVTTATEAATEKASISPSDRENEDDPFADADGWEIPKSFYIGGGVLGVFIIASIVVLIMGKPKEK